MSDDLDSNPFFIALKHRYKQLYHYAATNQWVICVPHSNSITEDELPITQAFAEMHVLAPSPYFACEYETMNKRQCEVEDSTITTGKGFAEPGREVTILNEEVFYNRDYKSHRVLIIDCPLEGGQQGGLKSSSTGATQDEGLIPIEERNCQRLCEWLQNIPGVTEMLRKYVDTSVRKFNRTYEIVEGFEMNAAKRLEDLCNNAKMRVFDVPAVVEFINQGTSYQELMEEAIEGYVMSAVHNKVWGALLDIFAEDDANLQEICARIGSITGQELGLREEICLEAGIPEAEKHLKEAAKYRAPRDMLRCIQLATLSVTKTLEQHLANQGLTDNKYVLTTDDLLPLLMQMMIRANVAHTVTRSHYLSHFNSSSISTTELGFHLANFQAASEFMLRDTLKPKVKTSQQKELVEGTPAGVNMGLTPSLCHWADDDSLEMESIASQSPTLESVIANDSTLDEPGLCDEGQINGTGPSSDCLSMSHDRRSICAVNGPAMPSNPITPINEVHHAFSSCIDAHSSDGECLGDFLDTLMQEGSSSLSSHQFREKFATATNKN